MQLDPARASALGGALGAAIAALAVLAELQVRGMGVLELHKSSVLVWVVEVLPFAFAVMGFAIAERSRPAERWLGPEPSSPPAIPAPAPPVGELRAPVSAPPPPVWVAPAAAMLEGKILVVDPTSEGPALAARFGQVGLTVVHVADVASASLAREAESPRVALVRGGLVGAPALLGELGRHGVPVLVIDPPRGARLPRLSIALERPDHAAVERGVRSLLSQEV